MLALFGGSSGPVPPFDLIQLSGKGSLFVTRPTCGTTWRPGRTGVARRRGAGMGSKGELKLRMEHVYALAEAPRRKPTWKAKTTGKSSAGAVTNRSANIELQAKS